MTKPFRFGSAISLAALASMIAGCAASQQVTGSGVKGDGQIGLATRAMAALSSNDIPTAISFAERAVEKTPDDAGYRGLLGNAYFAGGRFWSAEQAYKDALSIYPDQPRVILKLALVEIALGKNQEALGFLQAGRPVLDPADYGLAIALAGRTDDALAVLKASARAKGADARVRQNLALALALSGDWTNARAVAAQDVPAAELDARIQQWMQLAKPGKVSDQVASLVGVTPAAKDQGQPLRLALVKPETRMAQAAPAPKAVPAAEVPPPPVAVAQIPAPSGRALPVQVAQSAQPISVPALGAAPMPQFAEATPPAPPPVNPRRVAANPSAPAKVVSAKAQAVAPMTMALIAAAAPEAPSAFAAFMPKKAPPAAKPVKARAAAQRPAFRNSGAVVQLGAYRSPQYVSAAWNQLVRRHPALRAYLPMRARFVSPKGTFYRLSITGFANHREALARCQLLKSRGGACFVRNFAGDAPVQYASR